ncbi:collagen alpha-1(II) chain-like [Panthera leo]|uniref:collagen alpha-1(II) chain-like n=1 Tax=Panthera leo TaxID=9689 RepID=UPI001C698DCA|nr:collagen alpha-1(II) chain-like [Panthera leo]
MARAGEGPRAAGGSGRPQPPTPRWQLEMTGCEGTSDVLGPPAPGQRFQDTASNPPPTPGPPKPSSLPAPAVALREALRAPAQAPLTAFIRPFWNYLPGCLASLTLLESLPARPHRALFIFIIPRPFKYATWYIGSNQ